VRRLQRAAFLAQHRVVDYLIIHYQRHSS
jgi:hypothetical protein